MRQFRQRVKGRKSRLGEKQKGIGGTTKDFVSKEKIRGGAKLRISSTATSDRVEDDTSRNAAAKQKDEVGVTDRGDQMISTICKKLCSDGGGNGHPLSGQCIR